MACGSGSPQLTAVPANPASRWWLSQPGSHSWTHRSRCCWRARARTASAATRWSRCSGAGPRRDRGRGAQRWTRARRFRSGGGAANHTRRAAQNDSSEPRSRPRRRSSARCGAGTRRDRRRGARTGGSPAVLAGAAARPELRSPRLIVGLQWLFSTGYYYLRFRLGNWELLVADAKEMSSSSRRCVWPPASRLRCLINVRISWERDRVWLRIGSAGAP